MVVPLQEFVFVTVGAVVLSLLIVAALMPWARLLRRLVLIGGACAIGIILWNVALNVANATALNVDSDIAGLSVQDVGSQTVQPGKHEPIDAAEDRSFRRFAP